MSERLDNPYRQGPDEGSDGYRALCILAQTLGSARDELREAGKQLANVKVDAEHVARVRGS